MLVAVGSAGDPKLQAGFADSTAGALPVAGLPKELGWPNPNDGFFEGGSSVSESGAVLVSPNLNVGAGAGVAVAPLFVSLPKLKVGALVVLVWPKSDGADV